jgi:hypothetical protein
VTIPEQLPLNFSGFPVLCCESVRGHSRKTLAEYVHEDLGRMVPLCTYCAGLSGVTGAVYRITPRVHALLAMQEVHES